MECGKCNYPSLCDHCNIGELDEEGIRLAKKKTKSWKHLKESEPGIPDTLAEKRGEV